MWRRKGKGPSVCTVIGLWDCQLTLATESIIRCTEVRVEKLFFVTSFYRFFPLAKPEELQQKILNLRSQWHLNGLIILGTEGINATVCSVSQQGLDDFKIWLKAELAWENPCFKDSQSEVPPFLKLRIKIREEIVTLKTPELLPGQKNHHLSPEEWNHVLREERDAIVIDTRNWYEYQLGTFKGAINPDIEQFTEFPKYMDEHQIQKNQKILIFCTGGIRCEKGILELQRQGYDQVFQLDGGILNYLNEKPNEEFEGECFVFDHRVALDQNLKPTKTYKLCPHCGQPASHRQQCVRCDRDFLVCDRCLPDPKNQNLCSKNCQHHHSLHPERKGNRQLRWYDPEHLEKAVAAQVKEALGEPSSNL